MDAINKESRVRREKRKEQIKKLKTKQAKFLTRCQNLARKVIIVPEEVDTEIPLKKSYQLFESVVSSFQERLQENKEEKEEETSVLLINQYTTFSEAHNLLKEHIIESITIEEVLRNWFTYYGQVFQ